MHPHQKVPGNEQTLMSFRIKYLLLRELQNYDICDKVYLAKAESFTVTTFILIKISKYHYQG